MYSQGGVVLLVIAGCEIGFWIVVAAGLIARYPLRSPVRVAHF